MHTLAFRNKNNPPSWAGRAPVAWHVALVVGILAGFLIGGAL